MKQRLSKEHTLGSLGERMNERVPKRSCTAVNAEERSRERERERESVNVQIIRYKEEKEKSNKW